MLAYIDYDSYKIKEHQNKEYHTNNRRRKKYKSRTLFWNINGIF